MELEKSSKSDYYIGIIYDIMIFANRPIELFMLAFNILVNHQILFNDSYLKDLINSERLKSVCSYCEKSKLIVPKRDLSSESQETCNMLFLLPVPADVNS